MQPHRLSDGDRIEIGGHGLTFRQPNQGNPDTHERSTEKTLQDIRALTCWLLVADIEGHTKMVQQMSPGEISRITGGWLESCKKIIDSNEGVLNKFLGDGFFAYWNAEETGVVERVIQTLRTLMKLQTKFSPRFRWVLHYGRVYSGGPTFGEESLMGGEVNFIFRMEKLASKLHSPLLISEPATQAFGSALTFQEAGRHALAGFDGETMFFTI
jgi:adenylate cyclase